MLSRTRAGSLDSIDEVDVPIERSVPVVLDLATGNSAGLTPFYKLAVDEETSNHPNATTMQISLLNSERLREISVNLGLKFPTDIVKLAGDYSKHVKSQELLLAFWGERVLESVAMKVTGKADSEDGGVVSVADHNRLTHGTHYLYEKTKKAGFCYVVSIVTKDVDTARSVKAAFTEPNSSIGLSAEMKSKLQEKMESINAHCFTRNMEKPNLADSKDLETVLANVQKLETALTSVNPETAGITNGRYVSYLRHREFLAAIPNMQNIITRVKKLKKICRLAISMAELYSNYYEQSTHPAVVTEVTRLKTCARNLRAHYDGLRGVLFNERDNNFLHVIADQVINSVNDFKGQILAEYGNPATALIPAHGGAAAIPAQAAVVGIHTACIALNGFLTLGRSYNLKAGGLYIAKVGTNAARNPVLGLTPTDSTNVIIYHVNGLKMDVDQVVTSADPILLQLITNKLKGFLHYNKAGSLEVKWSTPFNLSLDVKSDRYNWTLAGQAAIASAAAGMPMPCGNLEREITPGVGNNLTTDETQISSIAKEYRDCFIGRTEAGAAATTPFELGKLTGKHPITAANFRFELDRQDDLFADYCKLHREISQLSAEIRVDLPLIVAPGPVPGAAAHAAGIAGPFAGAAVGGGHVPAAGGAGALVAEAPAAGGAGKA